MDITELNILDNSLVVDALGRVKTSLEVKGRPLLLETSKPVVTEELSRTNADIEGKTDVAVVSTKIDEDDRRSTDDDSSSVVLPDPLPISSVPWQFFHNTRNTNSIQAYFILSENVRVCY